MQNNPSTEFEWRHTCIAIKRDTLVWAHEACVAFASVTLPAAPAASNLLAWVPFQDTAELKINSSNSWSLQNGKNNRWDDSLWRNAYFYSQTDLLPKECTSCVFWGGHTSRPLLVRMLTHSLHHMPERLELTHMWQQSSKFLSTHRYGVLLGARNEVSCVVTNISFHFLLLGPFAQVQELMEGVRWEVVGALAFQLPTQEQRFDSASSRDGEALLLPLSLRAGSALLLQSKSGGEKTR